MTSPQINIIDALDDPALFEPWFAGPTWAGWRAILKAAFALPMSEQEEALFREVAERAPPDVSGQRALVHRGPARGKGFHSFRPGGLSRGYVQRGTKTSSW